MTAAKLTIARELSYDAFIEVMELRKDPDEVSERLISQLKEPFKRLDRAFLKEVLYGGLRWYAKIYWIVQNTSKRDLARTSSQVRAALILGTYQIFYMDRVPDRAAVNESVEYVRKKGQASAVTFVNGILRSISRRAEYFTKPDKDKNPCDYLALQYAHPQWLVERWHRRFHFEKLKVLLASNNQPPPYTIRLNSLKVPLDQIQGFRSMLLREEKNHSEKASLRSCLHLKNSPNLEPGSLFQQGYYTIQDEASQIITYLVNPQKGDTIVDACAGPGGKCGHIYEMSEGQAEIFAVEKNPHQIRKGQSTSERLGHKNIKWIFSDFLNFTPPVPVNRILLDAPCTGLGVLRRHPEGKWQKTQEMISILSQQQRALIRHALSILSPGGELIYSVCSFELEESSDHLSWINEEFKDTIKLVSPVFRLPGYYKKYVTRDNVLVIYSGNKDGMDGFSAFVLQKKV